MKNLQPISNADITKLKTKPLKYLHSLKVSYEKMISGFQEYLDYHELNGRFLKDENFNGVYNITECDRQFDKCLKGRKTGVTIKTFFAAAYDAGVNVKT